MKKTLFIFITICLAFTLVCCDAESIVKTGTGLQKVKGYSAGYAGAAAAGNLSSAMEEAVRPAEQMNGPINVLDAEKISKVSNAIITASETSAGTTAIAETMNKKLDHEFNSLFASIGRINIRDAISEVEDFAGKVDDYAKETLGEDSEKYNTLHSFLTDNLAKVNKVIENAMPAIDAIQSMLNQIADRSFVSYGDYVAESIFMHVLNSAASIIGAADTKAALIEYGDIIAGDIKVLEIIYNVSFNFPQLASNFLAD